jgi:ABC-type multidrug transport system fused ATPase/permease subunit
MNPLTYVIINLAILWLIHSGAVEVSHGNLSSGEVLALYNYMSQILIELIKLANLIISITRALASASRISDTLSIQSSDSDGKRNPNDKSEYAVEFSDVSLKYNKNADNALTDISFKVKRGDCIGIIGGTGSGKSTILNLIPRFYDVTSGAVLVDGCDVRQMDFATIYGKIGYIPQQAFLFSGTIADNLRYDKEDATDEELWSALETAQARDFVEKLPDGLESLVSQNGTNLSGGQKQRLCIARAIVKKAEFYIFDDSFSALDFATDARLRSALRSKLKNASILIVAQRVGTIIDADKIIVLDKGQVVGVGTHKQLLEACEVYKDIVTSQLSTEEVEQ